MISVRGQRARTPLVRPAAAPESASSTSSPSLSRKSRTLEPDSRLIVDDQDLGHVRAAPRLPLAGPAFIEHPAARRSGYHLRRIIPAERDGRQPARNLARPSDRIARRQPAAKPSPAAGRSTRRMPRPTGALLVPTNGEARNPDLKGAGSPPAKVRQGHRANGTGQASAER